MEIDNTYLSHLMQRIGLGIFFLVFGILKFTASEWFINGPYKGFYGTVFPAIGLYAVGALQLAMALSFFTNKYTKWAAWLGAVFLFTTIVATLPKILTVFQLPPKQAPPGFLFVAAIPLLFMAVSEALKNGKRAAVPRRHDHAYGAGN